jgi:D-alanyl-lipoteichoic acid acyltransferase DltB (MBOAT superfamily)
MLFHTTRFFLFFAVVLLLFYTAPRAWRRWILLAASYYFYMCWNAKFILLILVLTAIDFTAGIWLARVAAGPKRKTALVMSLAANLGFLGFFKYYNFLAGNVALLLGMPIHSFALNIILPMGISFHTFQSMSYVIDVYRGEQAPITDPVDYALFIAFFPQLVAGPIVRARNFFADLYKWRAPDGREQLRGVLLVVFGLLKKLAIADQFARLADAYFANPAAYPGYLAAWSGVAAFSLQIFFDFSGYTDMAIGLAQLLGFHFPDNFRRPYLSRSITEFWRRWHISLSTWLRDYLYVPLGGNRHGRWRTYRNLMLTMLLGGLWHGASWNFVIWGGYHGALLGLERAMGVRGERRGWKLLDPIRAALTFGLVTISWVFFRASTLHASIDIIGRMFTGAHGHVVWPHWMLWYALLALLLAGLEERLQWFERLPEAPAWAYASAIAVCLFCLELIGFTDRAVPFVYFQF